MRYLSLFSGAGGGDLAAQHLKGWECVGYVEFNDYCQRVIAARINDGLLDRAPIFGDIRHFIQSGAAREYRGFTDVVTGGFPCQPFSAAGKQLGADDPRNMWPATVECIRIIRPRYAFLENVSALLSSGYFGTILGDLAESGYDAKWRILSAAELGAPHKRDRVWIVADAKDHGHKGHDGQPCHHKRRWANGAQRERFQHTAQCVCADVAHADKQGLALRQRQSTTGKKSAKRHCCARGEWWAVEPDVGRVVNGLAHRVERVRALGNGQVPIVAATAWDLLTEVVPHRADLTRAVSINK